MTPAQELLLNMLIAAKADLASIPKAPWNTTKIADRQASIRRLEEQIRRLDYLEDIKRDHQNLLTKGM